MNSAVKMDNPRLDTVAEWVAHLLSMREVGGSISNRANRNTDKRSPLQKWFRRVRIHGGVLIPTA